MVRRLVAVAAAALALALPARTDAQATQAVSFNVGYFSIRGEDARVAGDVLVEDLNSLVFDIGEFSNASAGADWLIGLNQFVEAGFGLGIYRRTVPSVYRDLVNADGTEIAQDLKLRIIPLTATVRFLPLGRSGGVQPYVGAGVGVYAWRYSETGEFVDFRDRSIFRASYVASGNETGPVVLGGLRVPMGDRVLLGGEVRYQKAEADISVDEGFLSDKIDLGGYVSQVVFLIRF